ncbi:MAG: hypothetical protein ACREQP_22915 [Candidatus Binatia bacterium]
MRFFFKFIERNIAEIDHDPALRIYGGLLAFQHVLTFLLWKFTFPLEQILAKGRTPICWPFFEDCHALRLLDATGVRTIAWCYLAIAVVSTALFLSRRVKTAYLVLLGLNLLKFLILAQDFQLRANQHYMAGFVSIAYLFLPHKRSVLRFLVVSFYFWSGTLKLNNEWLSGAALYGQDRLWFKGALHPWIFGYVVVLELFLAFGVLAKQSWIFWSTLVQLIFFHIFSWPIVGFFYPTTMFTILAIFPLCRLKDAESGESKLISLFRGREPRITYATLALFSMLQVIPYAFPGDTAITGEGRIFALHMFDAQVVCNSNIIVRLKDGTLSRLNVIPKLPVRIRCDPIVYFNVAHQLCRNFAKVGTVEDLDLYLRSRRSSEDSLRPVLEVKNFCRQSLTYDLWRHNSWILT